MANTTISVENPNQGSLHIKLSEISNSLADIYQTLSLYPAIKKGMEEPDYSKQIKKLKQNIKNLQSQIDDLEVGISGENITEEQIASILISYLKIADFASNLKDTLLNTTLNDTQIKNKIKSIIPPVDLDNYYTTDEVDSLYNECLKD